MATISLDDLRALRVKVRSTHLKAPMDPIVHEAIGYIITNIADFHAGAASPRRAYFVTGPAGTGKTTSVRHAVSKFSELLTQEREYGEKTRPYVYVKLPKQCRTLDMVRAILDAMGLPTSGREKDLTDVLLHQLRERGTKILHLDELQHTVRSNSNAAFEAAQDFIKQLVDREDWPLHAILSGMPRLENMRRDAQICRRSKVIPFHRMDFEADGKELATLLIEIAVTQCGLELDDTLNTDEFRERLCCATEGAWGTTIEMIQSTCFMALSKGKKVLTPKHFAEDYEATSGALREQNIFIAPTFRDIKPINSLAPMTEE